eukprot:UN12076
MCKPERVPKTRSKPYRRYSNPNNNSPVWVSGLDMCGKCDEDTNAEIYLKNYLIEGNKNCDSLLSDPGKACCSVNRDKECESSDYEEDCSYEAEYISEK